MGCNAGVIGTLGTDTFESCSTNSAPYSLFWFAGTGVHCASTPGGTGINISRHDRQYARQTVLMLIISVHFISCFLFRGNEEWPLTSRTKSWITSCLINIEETWRNGANQENIVTDRGRKNKRKSINIKVTSIHDRESWKINWRKKIMNSWDTNLAAKNRENIEVCRLCPTRNRLRLSFRETVCEGRLLPETDWWRHLLSLWDKCSAVPLCSLI